MASGLTFNIFGHDVSATSALHKVEGQADSSSKRIGSSFKRLGGVIAGAFTGYAVVSFFKNSIAEATEAQKVGAQTAAVLKSTGQAAGITAQQIGDLANAISEKTAIDDEAIQSGENLLLTFTNIRNEAGRGNDIFSQATQLTTDLSVAMGKSLTSSATMVGKALNDPIKGITALTRVGVSFTEQQIEQVKAMVETGDTMGAQKLILAELNREFAGSAEAQATPAEKAKVAWANLQEQIGTYLLPVLAKLSNFIVNSVIPAVRTAIQWIQKHKEGFKQLGQTLIQVGKFIFENIVRPIAQALIPVVKRVIEWIKEHQEGLKQLAHVIASVLVVAVKILVGWIKVSIAIFKAAGEAVKWLWHGVIQPASHGIAAAWKTVSGGVRDMWHVIKDVFDQIRSGVMVFKEFIQVMVHVISEAWKSIGDGLQWAWDHTIGPVINTILAAIREIKAFLGGPFANDFDWDAEKGVLVPRNAQGTGFFPGGRTLVGELGPEMVNLPHGSSVSPTTVTASWMRMNNNNGTQVKSDPALLSEMRALRAEVAGLRRDASLPGDVHLDGYKVGRVEGRRANRYERGDGY